MTTHNFRDSLELSQKYAEAPWWDEVYRAAFPDLMVAQSVRDDGWAQRGGIDRLLMLSDGTVLKVDEKVREQAWPDILLEVWSNYEKRVLGWARKPLTCDFIAYAYIPTQICYLLPFQLLRRALVVKAAEWNSNAHANRNGFRWVDAKNCGYTTRSIAVPTKVLMDAIVGAMQVTWQSVGKAA
jgi:hypothetical protein